MPGSNLINLSKVAEQPTVDSITIRDWIKIIKKTKLIVHIYLVWEVRRGYPGFKNKIKGSRSEISNYAHGRNNMGWLVGWLVVG